MGRFNKSNSGVNKVKNYEGATAYKVTPEMELYSTVCTAMLQNKFYESTEDTVKRIRALIKKVKVDFAWNLAIYARKEMHMRSVPLVLAVELIKQGCGNSDKIAEVIDRADEITEILAYYKLANGNLKPIANSLKKGIAKAFRKFDEYQLAKYNRNNEIKLKDAMFLCHPKPTSEEEKELFNKLANDNLEVPYTWEVELSKAGKEDKSKKKVWEELIMSEKLGYMATMRNLRNFLEEEISDESIKKVGNYLSNEKAVKYSRQLPFRFLSAYRVLADENYGRCTYLMNKLEEAAKLSMSNIKGFDFDTKVLIACDVSGSMQQTISKRSVVQLYDIGLLLAMGLQNECENVTTGIFGNIWKVKNLPSNSILQNTMDLHRIEGEVGYATNGHKVIEWALEVEREFDKIMIFTDAQMWDTESSFSNNDPAAMQSAWSKYKKMFPNAKLYLFNLEAYGSFPLDIVSDKDVFLISGWSNKIFDVLNNLEKGESIIDKLGESIIDKL